MNLKEHIRTVPDFPRPGILFYDIATLLAHPPAWQAALERLTTMVRGYHPDVLVGIESRGFLLAAPLAARLGLSFAMIRKKGKLPGKVISHTYDLEYGTDVIEIQPDIIGSFDRAVILDDLVATGGTAAAAVNLMRRIGVEPAAVVCLIELSGLMGRNRIDVPVATLLSYEDENP